MSAPEKCTVDGCERRSAGRHSKSAAGLCSRHALRLRMGMALEGPSAPLPMEPASLPPLPPAPPKLCPLRPPRPPRTIVTPELVETVRAGYRSGVRWLALRRKHRLTAQALTKALEGLAPPPRPNFKLQPVEPGRAESAA